MAGWIGFDREHDRRTRSDAVIGISILNKKEETGVGETDLLEKCSQGHNAVPDGQSALGGQVSPAHRPNMIMM